MIHGPIATNILNIYTFSVATQALDVKVNRRKLSLFVGVFAMAAVVFFIFQADLASVLDTWLIGIVAWIAAWGGIMLVHYYKFEPRQLDADVLFEPVGTQAPARRQLGDDGVLCGRRRRHLDVPLRPDAGPAGLRSPVPWVASTCRGWPAACRLPRTYALIGGRVHRRYAAASDSGAASPSRGAASPSEPTLVTPVLGAEQ